jgi:rRNA maturation endonuclease Nob1
MKAEAFPNLGKCGWVRDDENKYHWTTGCGSSFVFLKDDPTWCGIKFCPYCGDPVSIANAKN